MSNTEDEPWDGKYPGPKTLEQRRLAALPPVPGSPRWTWLKFVEMRRTRTPCDGPGPYRDFLYATLEPDEARALDFGLNRKEKT